MALQKRISENGCDVILFNRKSHLTFSIEEIFQLLYKELSSGGLCLCWEQANFLSNSWSNRKKIGAQYSNLSGKLVHITGDITFANLFSNRKNIITIHDVEVLKRNRGIKKWLLNKIWFQLPARKATMLTVISNETKRELLSEIKIPESKIRVIPNPLNPKIVFSPLPNNRTKKILALGTKKNKNLPRLVAACNGLAVHLHIIGKLNNLQQETLNTGNVSYSNDFDLTFEEVIEHYYNCDLVAFVSTYEGFGMPIIEAQAAGRPVLTSNRSSMPEVAGEGALLVNPFSIDAIKNGISKIINDVSFRDNLIQKGRQNVERFEVKKIATQYQELYKEVLDEA